MPRQTSLKETPQARLEKLANRESSQKRATNYPVHGTRIDPDLVRKVKIASAIKGITMQEFIAEAIEEKLSQVELLKQL